MPRMRTIDQTIAYLRESDPQCALSKSALRRMVREGKVPAVQVGHKTLLDLDTIEDYLTGKIPATPPTEYGVIRRIV